MPPRPSSRPSFKKPEGGKAYSPARSGGKPTGRPPAKSGGGGRFSARPAESPRSFYGVLEIGPKGIFVRPASRAQKFTAELARKDLNGALDGEIVFVAKQEMPAKPGKKSYLGDYKVVSRLGSAQDVRNYSLLSALEAGLQPQFPPKIVDAGYDFTVPELGAREDLRALPLVTIDGEDARDFDDAVYARPADDGQGWYAIIAIADVAHYVRGGGILDKEALRRGNSTYFPDRVIPMLPERLSNDLCSLREGEDRACMHVHVWIDEAGQITDWNVGRGLMRSAARLTYTQVQKALDGQAGPETTPVLQQLQYLYKAYQCLLRARRDRDALDIETTERKIILDTNGGVAAVVPRERFEAHQLIEEFMITANVVVALALEAKSAPCMYRVHDTPTAAKIATLDQFIKPLGMDMPKDSGEIAPSLFNNILRKVKDTPDLSPVINDLVLRSQAQAVYSPDNIGHFGLALPKYAHFTSPIRRYADLLNHRSLITAYELGEDGLSPQDKNLMAEWAEQISVTERTSMVAERGCVDRFTAHFLQQYMGKELEGRITSVTNFGLFISLLNGVGEALVPMRMLPDDFYDFIEEKQMLVGSRSGRKYRMGGKVSLQILSVDPLSGSVTGQLLGTASATLGLGDDDVPERPQRPPARKPYDKGAPRGRSDGPRKAPYGDRERGGDRDRKPSYADRPRRDAAPDDRPPRRPRREDSEESRSRYVPRDKPDRTNSASEERGPRRAPSRPFAPRPPRDNSRAEPREDRPRRDDKRDDSRSEAPRRDGRRSDTKPAFKPRSPSGAGGKPSGSKGNFRGKR